MGKAGEGPWQLSAPTLASQGVGASRGGESGVPYSAAPFLSGIHLSAVSVPLSGTKFAGPLVALHLPLSLSRALLSFSLTGRGLFTALFISLSVGKAQAELHREDR